MDVELTTERLTLCPVARADAPRLIALANNWNVASKLGRMSYPYGPDEAVAFVAKWAAAGDHAVFAMAGSDGLIGCAGLHRDQGEAYELGYWLGEPYWGRGFATEAAGALVDHGFQARDLSYLTAGHFLDNPASGRVLQKLGFRYSGEAERDCLARGCKVRSLEMTLSRADWNER